MENTNRVYYDIDDESMYPDVIKSADLSFMSLASNKGCKAWYIYIIDKSNGKIKLYAVTDAKKTLKLFKKQRNMKQFLVKKVEYDEYEDKLNDMMQHPGEVLSVCKFEYIDYESEMSGPEYIDIAATRIEYDYSTTTETLLTAMEDSFLAFPFKSMAAFNRKYLKCLSALYFGELLDLFSDTPAYESKHGMMLDAFEEILDRHFDPDIHSFVSDYSAGANLEIIKVNALENFINTYKDTLSL